MESTPAASSELRKAPPDSVMQFLLASAASDFHSHGPPNPVRFRDVRLGHMKNPNGEVQYFLCGEFLPAPKESTGEWRPFATIQTSGYEQWIGAQAAGFCNGKSVILDDVSNLSAALQSRLDSLR
jgi:hypothetical protein